jgi:hypothetical protein
MIRYVRKCIHKPFWILAVYWPFKWKSQALIGTVIPTRVVEELFVLARAINILGLSKKYLGGNYDCFVNYVL